MDNLDRHLKYYLREQIALEEQLCGVIEEQIAEIDERKFADAKKILVQTQQALERQFKPLNETLDRLEQEKLDAQRKNASGNGEGFHLPIDSEKEIKSIARMLRDDYGALNHITMGNMLLHTTALALDCEEVASIALAHLKNIAPLVIRIGELVPEVVTRELRTESEKIDLSVAGIALRNARLAWRQN